CRPESFSSSDSRCSRRKTNAPPGMQNARRRPTSNRDATLRRGSSRRQGAVTLLPDGTRPPDEPGALSWVETRHFNAGRGGEEFGDRARTRVYSYLKASIGSRRDAFCAG